MKQANNTDGDLTDFNSNEVISVASVHNNTCILGLWKKVYYIFNIKLLDNYPSNIRIIVMKK